MRRFTVLATIVALLWNTTALVSGPGLAAAQDATPPAGGDAGSTAPAVGDAVPFLGSDGKEIGRVTVTALADPWEEYEAVRSDPLLFAMKPGHADLEVDVVVAANERFETVRKRPSESAIARETSPR